MKRLTELSIIGLLALGQAPLLGASASLETQKFSVASGDTLIIQSDYGRVLVRGASDSQLQVRIRKIASTEERLDKIQVVSEKKGDKVFIYSFFQEHRSESVYLEILTPRHMNVVVWGANPAVELYGIQGYVRAHTLTGLITAEDLTSSVSLVSDSGDIVFRSRLQPEKDVRMESTYGGIRCELGSDLNVRGWARAGGILSWNRAIELQNGSLEKQVGVGGPLLYASSLKSDVRFVFSARGKVRPVEQARPNRDAGVATGSQTDVEPNSPPDSEYRNPLPRRVNDSSSAETTSSEQSTKSAPEIDSSPRRPPARVETASPSGGAYSLRVNVDWVYLNVSVRDRHTNRSVPYLRKEDFVVYEDGIAQQVEQFQSVEAPFNLVLLLDVSGSTRRYLNLIKQASIDFTREINSNDRIAVAVFNSRTRLAQDLTGDRRKVARAIDRIRSGGGTAFYDALETSVNRYLEGIEGRKAVVVFTDGVDNRLTGDYSDGSLISFQDLFRSVEESDSIIYTIFLDTERDNPSRRSGGVIDVLGDIIRGRTPPYNPGRSGGERQAYEQAREQLRKIADQTGGRMYAPRRIEDLSQVYSEIADDLRIQYRVAYNSTNTSRDGRWRKVRVKIKDKPNALARTRRGYYAGSQVARHQQPDKLHSVSVNQS